MKNSKAVLDQVEKVLAGASPGEKAVGALLVRLWRTDFLVRDEKSPEFETMHHLGFETGRDWEDEILDSDLVHPAADVLRELDDLRLIEGVKS